MSKINEQIQRLRDVLVTCYNAIKRKGGTIPEVGERNMTNLPAAVLSIPQVHSELTELTVTANGEYLPADHNADGFSKVTAKFDTSSLPKVKVTIFQVSDNCINDEGVWEGESLIDTSEITVFPNTFYSCTKLKHINIPFENANALDCERAFYGCTNLKSVSLNKLVLHYSNQMFRFCKSLTNIDVSSWNFDRCTMIAYMFDGCSSLVTIDMTQCNIPNSTLETNCFSSCSSLQSIIGNRTIEDVLANNIGALNGLKNSANMFNGANNLDRASLRALINGLADLTGQTAQTLTLGATLIAKLTEEDIAVATNKNWTLS